MPKSIGVGGAWKNVAGVFIGVGGAWKTLAGKWVGVGGAWEQVFAPNAVNLIPAAVRAAGRRPTVTSATAKVEFGTDGKVRGIYTQEGAQLSSVINDWISPLPGSLAAYEIIFIPQTGTFDVVAGSALNTWLTLSSVRSFSITNTAVGGVPTGGTMLARIRLVGSTVILAEANFAVSAVLYPSGTTGGIGGGINQPNDFYYQQM
jgi:hypothetical protein